MSPIDAITVVMRTLADPTRRAVFERIVGTKEIRVAELTRGSGVTQGAISQHLKSLKLAGLVAERPDGRNVFYRAQPEGLTPLVDWMSHYGLFWRERFASQNAAEGDRAMNDAAVKSDTQNIVVDEVFPHAPETIWRTLTTGELIVRWLGMEPTRFEPVEGKHFTFQTTPAGAWDGVIRCQVLEVMPKERLAYTWKGGHEGNVGYGSRLDTVVTWN